MQGLIVVRTTLGSEPVVLASAKKTLRTAISSETANHSVDSKVPRFSPSFDQEANFILYAVFPWVDGWRGWGFGYPRLPNFPALLAERSPPLLHTSNVPLPLPSSHPSHLLAPLPSSPSINPHEKMAIIVDAKTPTQDASENSDTHHTDVPPPEYVAEELPHRTNNDLPVPVTTPADKPATTPTNHDRWWRRWMRSPIAIALIFLACAVIATGIGLAVHFTVGRSRPPEYPPWPDGGPGPYGPGGNMTGADAYGPWTSSVKTFSFPRDTAHMEFVSFASFLSPGSALGLIANSSDPPLSLHLTAAIVTRTG